MRNRSFAATARKKLLRRGRVLLRLRTTPTPGQADHLAGLSDADREQLAEIHSALERIERGIYGRCDSCFGDIEEERLLAVSWERECGACVHHTVEAPTIDLPHMPAA